MSIFVWDVVEPHLRFSPGILSHARHEAQCRVLNVACAFFSTHYVEVVS